LVRSSMDRTWTIVGVGGSPRLPSSGIPGEEDQVGVHPPLHSVPSPTVPIEPPKFLSALLHRPPLDPDPSIPPPPPRLSPPVAVLVPGTPLVRPGGAWVGSSSRR